MKIFAGTSNTELALSIASKLNLDLGNLSVEIFKDGEILPKFNESIRDQDIYLVQSPSNHSEIIETTLICDAAKRSGVKSITLICPYLPYSRQDKVDHLRSSIGAKVIADILQKYIDRIMIVDLHNTAIQGFFNIPVVHLNGFKIFNTYIKNHYNDFVIVSPDQGGFARAANFAKHYNCNIAVINKKRIKPNEVHSMELIGDVKDKNVIMVDDLGDTMNTMCKASDLLKESGAKSVIAIMTHGVLSGNAINNITNSSIDEVLFSDTINIYQKVNMCNKIKTISCGSLIADAIYALNNKKSIHEVNVD